MSKSVLISDVAQARRSGSRCGAVFSFCLAALFWVTPLAAETIKIGLQTGIGYLPLQVMAHNKLLEEAVSAAGAGNVQVELVEFENANAMNDALLAGAIQYASGGVSTFLVLWAKARGASEVQGVGAIVSMPMYLNTRNPRIKSIKDFDEQDRIGVAGIKVSYQAMLLQMAAANAFGFENYNKLDPLTVTVSNPNGVISLGNPKSEINTHFAPPPFARWELKLPDVHTVLKSYDILGGPATLTMVWGSSRFMSEHSAINAAFWKAFQEATRQINADKGAAAQIYLKASNDRKSTVAEILELLNDPEIVYSVTPNRVMAVADFMGKVGMIKRKASSWKDLFFRDAQVLPGS